MSKLQDELFRRREALVSYLELTGSVGIVLLDPALFVLDCNHGFMKMLNLQKKPIGLPVSEFLKLGTDDLNQSGELKVSCKNSSGADGILCCHVNILEKGLILFCERLMMTESRAMEQIGLINNELISLQRESVKKNLLLEKLRKELNERIAELEATLSRVKQLEGLIPICMYCKKIRDDQNSWHKLEKYISDHSEAEFTHGVCPHCYEKQMENLTDKKNQTHM
jgi:hypothetical protein